MSKKLPSQTYHNIDIEYLRNKLKLNSLQEKIKLHKDYPYLKKFFDERNIDLAKIREYSAKLIGAGVIASGLLLNPVTVANIPPASSPPTQAIALMTPQNILLDDLKSLLPERVQSLSQSEEKKLEVVFKDISGISAKANLEGEHLN